MCTILSRLFTFYFFRASIQIKRENLAKDTSDFKNEYSTFMISLSNIIQSAKNEHSTLTEKVCVGFLQLYYVFINNISNDNISFHILWQDVNYKHL